MTGFGIFAYFGYDLPLEESLRRLAAAGFDTVSLFWGAFDGGPPLHRQPELARRAGLRVENAHAPFDGVNALWTPGDDGDRYAASLVEALEGCAASGVPVLVAHLTDAPRRRRLPWGSTASGGWRPPPNAAASSSRWKTCATPPICTPPCPR